MPQGLRRGPVPTDRRPQINFQVDHAMKLLYEEAKASGHWVTRLCAAGLLLLIERPQLRRDALNRLREWEDDYAGASEEKVRAFVQNAEDAVQSGLRGLKPPPKSRKGK
jgi:hypothetical protein